jgi:hypothetical protein
MIIGPTLAWHHQHASLPPRPAPGQERPCHRASCPSRPGTGGLMGRLVASTCRLRPLVWCMRSQQVQVSPVVGRRQPAVSFGTALSGSALPPSSTRKACAHFGYRPRGRNCWRKSTSDELPRRGYAAFERRYIVAQMTRRWIRLAVGRLRATWDINPSRSAPFIPNQE